METRMISDDAVLLRVEKLVKYFPIANSALFRKETRVVHAVDGISFDVRHGEVLGIIGRNGAGKSTTLKAISGLLKHENGRVTDGSIEFMGQPIQNHDAADIVRLGIFQVLFEWIRQGANVPVLGGGANVYQFVHADDLADACILAARRVVPPDLIAPAAVSALMLKVSPFAPKPIGATTGITSDAIRR